ncbi:MAG: bifunctional isocitrate dehydrogenase kinase/phosphatase [Gammaproteobacteria bacterium]|nr:MAG: bifunctional isocitrate dehydrogenase kinase/phosphatase [Gammaproteobacteria bacterium]
MAIDLALQRKKNKTVRLTEAAVGEIARTILSGFNKHFKIFREVTQQGREHFRRGDWVASRQAACDRISLYDQRVQECITELKQRFNPTELDPVLWQDVKFHYLGLLYRHLQPELAESFYNSVFVGLFERHFYNNNNIFVRPSVSTERLDTDDPVFRSFYPTRDGWRKSVLRILEQADIGLPFENIRKDVRLILREIRRLTDARQNLTLAKHFQIQVLRPLFYRNKTAYIVGRAINGPDRFPLILILRRNDAGKVYVKGLISDRNPVANLFASARAYFLVDTEVPSAMVRFLLSILPEKTAADLYTQIGFHKQGKSEFYRDFLDHLQRSSDLLEIAPGSEGMVMLVFTLPSYPYVFKVIRDHFKPPKDTTRKTVIDKYHMIKQRDRVGRMSDAWEFSYTAFPIDRFTNELIEKLKSEVGEQVIIEEDKLIIKHLFIERRLEPLNLYLKHADYSGVANAIRDYGNAISEIAAAGLFPGDLLIKNFGITRYGRVIFYDYDEVVPIGQCNFRHIPEPRFPEDEFAAEPWYSVGPDDVFPEEFPTFLFHDKDQRNLFSRIHASILKAETWRMWQRSVAEGEFPD